jgi:exodeoxyribonuclease V alpha subunit
MTTDATETLIFQVAEIRYAKETDGFAIVRSTDGDSIKGQFRPKLGYCYSATGTWDRTSLRAKQYGPTFVVSVANAVELAANAPLGRFLAIQCKNLGLGIGEVFLTNLVTSCDEEHLALRDLLNHGEKSVLLELVGKRNARKVDILTDKWPEMKPQADLISPLLGLGFSPAQADTLILKYQAQAMEVVRNDPYGLITFLDGVGFLRADRIARLTGVAFTDTRRIRAALSYAIREATSKGDLGVPKAELLSATRLLLNATVKEGNKLKLDPNAALLVPDALTEKVLDEMLSGLAKEADGSACRFSATLREQPDEKGKAAIWFAPLLDAEDAICDRLRAFQAPALEELAAHPEDIVARAKMPALSQEQIAALRTALLSPVVIVTGGPGTGKSFFLKALLQAYRMAGLSGDLAAPTGKAAKRISQATGKIARTMHSLIGYTGGNDVKFDEGTPLDSQYLVIDEASMADVSIIAKTLQAARDSCRIVILGDVDQLASVGPGQVLRDLIRSKAIPVVRFTKGFRFSGGIAQAARQINSGVMPETTADEAFTLVDTDQPHVAIMEYAEKLYRSGVALTDILLLSPRHKGDAGCEALNRVAQQRFNPNAASAVEQKRRLRRDSGDILIGDRVIETKNFAGFDVMNGDMGWLDDIDTGTSTVSLVLDDKDKVLEVPMEVAERLRLGYAITVHKSQGAESPYVLIALDSAAAFFLQRSLIYTAVTRGKVKTVVFGSRNTLARAVHKGEPEEGSRRTLLASKIRAAMPALAHPCGASSMPPEAESVRGLLEGDLPGLEDI